MIPTQVIYRTPPYDWSWAIPPSIDGDADGAGTPDASAGTLASSEYSSYNGGNAAAGAAIGINVPIPTDLAPGAYALVTISAVPTYTYIWQSFTGGLGFGAASNAWIGLYVRALNTGSNDYIELVTQQNYLWNDTAWDGETDDDSNNFPQGYQLSVEVPLSQDILAYSDKLQIGVWCGGYASGDGYSGSNQSGDVGFSAANSSLSVSVPYILAEIPLASS